MSAPIPQHYIVMGNGYPQAVFDTADAAANWLAKESLARLRTSDGRTGMLILAIDRPTP